MAYDFTTTYMPYEYRFREYPMHEMMNDHMEYVRRPWKRTNFGGICVVCSTVKRPTELVDGRISHRQNVICLRCAIPPCKQCGDTAWAWELIQGGFRPPHNVTWTCFDLQNRDRNVLRDPEGQELPNEISGSLLRQLCLQGVSWESFREKDGLRKQVSPTSPMLCPLCKSGRSCPRCKKRVRVEDFDRDHHGNLYKVCRACQHPTCSICGATRGSIWTPSPKVEEPVPLCDDCENKRTCADCGRLLDADYLVVEEIRYELPFF